MLRVRCAKRRSYRAGFDKQRAIDQMKDLGQTKKGEPRKAIHDDSSMEVL